LLLLLHKELLMLLLLLELIGLLLLKILVLQGMLGGRVRDAGGLVSGSCGR
jgi:hypothetical protein